MNRSFLDPLLVRVVVAHAQRQFKRFMRAAQTAVQTQERVLLAKIARCADSVYGREHQFSQIRSYQDFIDRVPVQTYDDLKPYVQRVMDGDVRAMFGRTEKVLMFAMTSGSTDKPKYVPVTTTFLREYRRGWNVFGIKALLDHPTGFLRSILQVVSPMDEHRTPLGIPCGSISGLLAATQKRLVRKYYVTPRETANISDPQARYYTIMRVAVPHDVSWMITASPATQLKLVRMAATHAQRLIRDVHDGTLRPPGDIPDSVRCALMANSQPDHETARRLTALVDKHGELLPKHYWKLAFLANWTGGTMGLHLRDFPHYFGETPVRDIGLLATEGRVSIPLEDGTPAGLLDAEGSFFEFIDADADEADADAVHRCHELVAGREYRVLLTTSAGFYRYDIGDHVRVVRMEGPAPVLEFLNRGARTSSITGEKLTEWQVTAAFERCCTALGLFVTNFVLAPCWADPPFYRLHIERQVQGCDRLADALDKELSTMNIEYGSKRSSRRLGPIVQNLLPPGTLAKFDVKQQHRHGAPNEQYKHQYLYTKPGDDAPFPLETAEATPQSGVQNA
ncbi:MAG: GH3 auxin-responsive promoter family protein [Planctomycetes bacterium]|nr:GH3 auxin-responsive promoter family protein [Planctomycetota bacterium]